MDQLIFVTNNQHKLQEVKEIMTSYPIISLHEAGLNMEIPENELTIEENALSKAKLIHRMTARACFADDTGLEVEALNGGPGVHSARYAGEPPDAEKNIDKLLHELRDISSRKARFKTVIALILNDKEHIFEGIVEGKIAQGRRGENGFGYDPVFIPSGYTISFAEMSPAEKNKISHRARALEKMKEFLLPSGRSDF